MSANSRKSLMRAKLAQQMLKSAKGFTLIELLVVIVIVGVLSAVAIPTFLNQIKRARVAEGQSALNQIGLAAEVYRFDEGVYPTYKVLAADSKAAGTYLETNLADAAPNYKFSEKGLKADGVTYIATGQGTAYKEFTCRYGLGDNSKATNLDTSKTGKRACTY